MRSFLRFLAPGLLLAAAAGSAEAGMLGSTITACWDTAYNSGSVTTNTSECNGSTAGFTSAVSTVINPGVEFSTLANNRLFDFGDNTITITYISYASSPSPDLFIFTGLPAMITGLTLLSTNDLNITTAFDATSIGFLINNPHCCTTTTTSVVFQVESNPIPEPAAYAGTALGLAAIGLARRRFRRG
jgi:hypothetical protein